VPDVEERLPGRGMWVAADGALIGRAVERNAFARAARRPVSVPEDLLAMTDRAVARRALELLGIARRAGVVIAGKDAILAAARADRLAVLLVAADAAPESLAKFAALAAAIARVDCFALSEMSLALGGENVVHAGLAPSSLSEQFLRQAQRLRGLRGGSAVVPLPEAIHRSAETIDQPGSRVSAPALSTSTRVTGLPEGLT
jgi:hypothetical protein